MKTKTNIRNCYARAVMTLLVTLLSIVTAWAQTPSEGVNDEDFSLTGDNEYTIKTATGWEMFCNMLEGGESFSGKTVTLEANIGTEENPVRRMAGGTGHEFAGTFDGEGKTLYVNITGTVQGTAPFCEIKGATIRNLVVTGSVAGMRHSAGLVGFARGDDASVENTIENCLVATDVSITGDDRGYLGGIVGHGLHCKLTIRGCAFTGSLTSESYYTGGLQGWSDGNTLILTDDLFAPTSVSAANVGFHPIAFHLNNATTTATVSNVYYTVEPTCTTASRIATTSAAEQPQAPLSVTAGENVTVEVSPVGDATTTYSVSGITAYAKGITYNDTFYYGSGDQVNLTLSHGDAPEGNVFACYTTSPAGATLTGTANPYTLTMPDDNVEIGAKFAVPIPYIDEYGEEQTCADYILITNDMTTLGSEGEETWYVVNDVVTINNGLEVKGDVHLILADNASLTVNPSMSAIYDASYNGIDYLTIYGQGNGNGKLNLTRGNGFDFHSSLTINGGEIDVDAGDDGFYIEGGSLTINGGKVDVKAQNDGIRINTGSLTINGGEVDVEAQNGMGINIYNVNLTINGGEVDARSEYRKGLYAFGSTITFGWIRPEGHIFLNCSDIYLLDCTVGIASGQTLTDGSSTYTGSNINVDDLNGKTLFAVVDVLNDASNNDIATLSGSGINTDVFISGRTLYKDGSWNTLCLPFNLPLSGSVLDGDNVELMTLSDASFSQGTLCLFFVFAYDIKAGKPYIIRWNNTGRHIVNPVFKGVKIVNASLDENAVTKNDVISFKGIYSPFEITEANNKLLYLGDGDQIYYPSAAMTINAFRAYFELQGDLVCGEPSSTDNETDNGINAFVLNFGEATSIENVQWSMVNGQSDTWYDLSGRKLNGKPTAKGIYIKDGKKFVIK